MKRLFLLKVSGLKDGGSFWGNFALEAESLEHAKKLLDSRYSGIRSVTEIVLTPGEILEFTIDR